MQDNSKEYGTLSRVENMELNTLASKLSAIESLVTRMILEQESYQIKRDQWFADLREKHDIPDDVAIVIKEDGRILQSLE